MIKCLFLLAQKDMEATIRGVVTVLPTQCYSLPLVTAPCFFRGDSTTLIQVRGFCGHVQLKYPHPLPTLKHHRSGSVTQTRPIRIPS